MHTLIARGPLLGLGVVSWSLMPPWSIKIRTGLQHFHQNLTHSATRMIKRIIRNAIAVDFWDTHCHVKRYASPKHGHFLNGESFKFRPNMRVFLMHQDNGRKISFSAHIYIWAPFQSFFSIHFDSLDIKYCPSLYSCPIIWLEDSLHHGSESIHVAVPNAWCPGILVNQQQTCTARSALRHLLMN